MSVNENNREVEAFIARHGTSYPFLMDRTGQISTSYDVSSTPTTYFIAPDGTIVDSLTGVVTEGWLESNLDDFIKT